VRARREDLGVLVASLLSRIPAPSGALTFTTAAARAIFAHDWPLNVRELEQCLLRSAALAPRGVIDVNHLPPAVTRARPERKAAAQPQNPASRALSEDDARLRRELLVLLERHGGNLADISRATGKARMQIHRWLKRFDIDPNTFRR
jgi:DNA-binding NtrC family response regulator